MPIESGYLQAVGWDGAVAGQVKKCAFCGLESILKYCDKTCQRKAFDAKRYEPVVIRCIRCGGPHPTTYRAVQDKVMPSIHCRKCKARLGNLSRAGLVEHWCPVYDQTVKPKTLSQRKKRCNDVEPRRIINYACETCGHGKRSTLSDTGWLCSAEAAMRCQPWGARTFWVKR